MKVTLSLHHSISSADSVYIEYDCHPGKVHVFTADLNFSGKPLGSHFHDLGLFSAAYDLLETMAEHGANTLEIFAKPGFPPYLIAELADSLNRQAQYPETMEPWSLPWSKEDGSRMCEEFTYSLTEGGRVLENTIGETTITVYPYVTQGKGVLISVEGPSPYAGSYDE